METEGWRAVKALPQSTSYRLSCTQFFRHCVRSLYDRVHVQVAVK